MTRLRFWRDRETRNTVVYQEERQRGVDPVIGTLYVRKTWWSANGEPDPIEMVLGAPDAPPAV